MAPGWAWPRCTASCSRRAAAFAVESAPGAWDATFAIYLPRESTAPIEAAPATRARARRPAGVRHDSLRRRRRQSIRDARSAARFSQHGYTVLTARHAAEAISSGPAAPRGDRPAAHRHRHAGTQRPGARRLTCAGRERPALKVLFTSGYSEEVVGARTVSRYIGVRREAVHAGVACARGGKGAESRDGLNGGFSWSSQSGRTSDPGSLLF